MAEVDLTEQQVSDFREAFKLFDRDGDGLILCTEVGVVLRAVGQNPTEAELNEFVKESQAQNRSSIDFPEFLTLVAKQMKNAVTEEDMRKAFKVFDRNSTGLIAAKDLRHFMTTIGETVTSEEVDQLIEELQVDVNGMINYSSFVSLLLGKS